MSKTEWRAAPTVHTATEHIIMIGSTPLTSLYIKFLEAYSYRRYRVIAVLDTNPLQLGRTIAGVRIVGPPEHLQLVADEFVEHGMRVHRVIVGGEPDLLPDDALVELQSACDRREIRLDFVPRLIGLNEFPSLQPEATPDNRKGSVQTFPVSKYFPVKRVIDFVAASVMIIFLLPVLLVVSGLVFLDLGSPVLFWQQRLGLGGRAFLLQKFRTLRPPFDWRGEPIPPEERLSWVGKLLRNLRLDELPQLLNVLVGDMSLIGPRPLLPHDQPTNPSTRLMVRPGITGWAQVNGGTLLTPEEKDNLDEWYIRNASLGLDFRIIVMTFQFLFTSQQRSERAFANAPSGEIPAFEANADSTWAKRPYRVQKVGLERRNEPRSKIVGSC
jgi:lipopolysaccharide/colanic/teichoic acid biosynthesis glycosyltransferase